MIKCCLFPSAGYGTRFLPATKAIPKELLPIIDRPLIQYAVEEAHDAGIANMGFITGRGKSAIADYFDIAYEIEKEIAGSGKEKQLESVHRLRKDCNFTFTRQQQMLGLGHAILAGRPLVDDGAFAVILPDDLCFGESNSVLTQMAELYDRFQCSIVAIEPVQREEVNRYGVIAGEEIEPGVFQVSDMVEKPNVEDAPSNMAIIGRYILTPDIFSLIERTVPGKNGEIQITDAILQQAKAGNVLGYQFKGTRFDCGSVEGYVQATNYCYDQRFR